MKHSEPCFPELLPGPLSYSITLHLIYKPTSVVCTLWIWSYELEMHCPCLFPLPCTHTTNHPLLGSLHNHLHPSARRMSSHLIRAVKFLHLSCCHKNALPIENILYFLLFKLSVSIILLMPLSSEANNNFPSLFAPISGSLVAVIEVELQNLLLIIFVSIAFAHFLCRLDHEISSMNTFSLTKM